MTTKKAGETKKAPEAQGITDVAELVRAERTHTRELIEGYRRSLRGSSRTLPKVVTYAKDDRKNTSGRIAADELEQLVNILDVVDADPAVFSSLAAKDHGKDPNKVETEPARHAIEILEALVPLVGELEAASRQAGDLALRLGELVRSVTTPAYAIANANAPINEGLRAGIAPTNDYYRNRVQTTKAAKAAKTTT